jgi:Uma2 family endonuclease
LIIEVLSPNDRMNKTTARIGQYLDRGVPVVWLVDPEVHSVAVYRPDQFPQVLDNSDELTGGDVLPDFRCKVSDLFKMPGE